ncbi:MAG: 3-methyl-2-oxobutanoate hydroxymethyltransferase [Candidatus Aminicenantes bacterium]|nr:3-methyl-2-oxobutanoate hydroxymethyltransferase [Candidatus Aminicenantes bacterium]
MPQPEEKRTIISLKKKKEKGEKITAVTAYDFPTAKIVSAAGIDMVLVGDSLGMVLQGRKNTLKVSLDEMIYHTSMVARAEPLSLIVGDMPFQSYHVSVEKSVENAARFVKEGGAEAVKVEGGKNRFAVIEAILNIDIPVLGHLGLTPQSIHKFGGFKVQGKIKEKANEILQDAVALDRLGVFAVVLESIPMELARKITEAISVPTIGIGAGKYCDGQILVFHDLVGITNSYCPKFARKYVDINSIMREALNKYIDDIHSGDFPADNESYHLNKDIEVFLR